MHRILADRPIFMMHGRLGLSLRLPRIEKGTGLENRSSRLASHKHRTAGFYRLLQFLNEFHLSKSVCISSDISFVLNLTRHSVAVVSLAGFIPHLHLRIANLTIIFVNEEVQAP